MEPTATIETGPAADPDVTRYVIVEMNSSQYGFPTGSTVELMSSSAATVTRVPKSPRFVRGVINHRGSIIPVVDTRSLLGLPTAAQQASELINLLDKRTKDHENWMDTLEASVRNGTPFTQQTDHNLCAFGRWYNEITGDARKMQMLARYGQSVRVAMVEMDAPHKRIHALAEELLSLCEDGKREKAIERLEHERATTFTLLRTLMGRVSSAVKAGFQPMLVITERGERKVAFEVDAVHTVKDCAESDIDALPETATGAEFMTGLVHQPDGGYILICDLEQMYEQASPT